MMSYIKVLKSFGKGLAGFFDAYSSVNGIAPLKTMLHAFELIYSEQRSIEVAMRKEKINLSRSNKPRQMFVQMILLIVEIKLSSRSQGSSLGALMSIALLKSIFTNQSEFWYISLIRAMSAITKQRIDPRTATLLNEARVLAMVSFVIIAFAILSLISPAVTFDFSRVMIRSSASRICSISEFLRVSRILSSISLSVA